MSKKKINKNKRKDKVNLFNKGGNSFSPLPENLTMPTMAGLPIAPSFSKMDLQNMKLNPINTMMKDPFQDKLGAAVGKFGTGVTSAVDILGSSLDNAKIADTSAQEASIDSQKNMVVGASSNDELMAEWGNFNKVKDNYTKRDVRGGSTGQRVSDTLSSTGKGVMGGMSVGGPIGGIVGGVVGLGSAIGGWLGGNRKARKKARKLNKAAKEANDRALTTLENKAEDIDTQNDFNMLANFSSLGGFLGDNSMVNIKAEGGKLGSGYGGDFSNGMREINAGGTHEENPNMGIQLGVDQEGTPNLVEQGEILFKDYVFSDRIKLPKDLKKEHKFRGKTFADAAKNVQRESKERPFDPISKRGLEDSMGRLMMAQEGIKEEQSSNEDNPNVFAKGGMKQTYTRFAPLVGSASGALSNIFSKLDYSEADRIQNVDTKPAMVGWSPIGNKLAYNPLDRDFYINKMNQQTAATRDNIRNTSGGNRAVAQAGLLASDYNYGQNLGNMARQAEEYNQAQRERVEGFNRQTNMYNTDTGLKAGMFNAESMNNSKRLQLSKAGSVAQMRQAMKEGRNASLSSNMSNLFQGLGDIGWENEQSNWLNMLARNGVLKMDTQGNYVGENMLTSPVAMSHNKRKGE